MGKRKGKRAWLQETLSVIPQIKQAVHTGRHCNSAASPHIPGATTQPISLRTPGFFFFFSSDQLRKKNIYTNPPLPFL